MIVSTATFKLIIMNSTIMYYANSPYYTARGCFQRVVKGVEVWRVNTLSQR